MRWIGMFALASVLSAQILAPIIGGKKKCCSFYVTQSGNDSCNGTSQALGSSGNCAWKTVAKVNAATLTPGQSVGFKRGDTWRETLTPGQSGAAGAPITFAAYGTGTLPQINGSDIATTWTLQTGSNVGNQATGTNGSFRQSTNIYFYQISTGSSSGTLSSYSLYCSSAGGGIPTHVQMALYSESAAKPGTVIAGSQSSDITSFISNGFTVIPITAGPSLSSSTNYWVGFQTSDAFAGCGDNTGGLTTNLLTGTTYGTWPSGGASFGIGTTGVGVYATLGLPNTYTSTVPYTALGVLDNSSWVEPQTSASAVSNTINSWYWSGNVLYLHTRDGSNPNSNGRLYEASRRVNGVFISGKSYVSLASLEVYGAGTAGAGVWITGAGRNIGLTDSTLDYNAGYGITAGDAGGVNLESAISIRNVTAHHNGYDGMVLAYKVTDSSIIASTAHHNGWFSTVNFFNAGIRASSTVQSGGFAGVAMANISFLGNVSYANGVDDAGVPRSGTGTNFGHGIWFDTLNTGSIMNGNLSYGNLAVNLHVENTIGALVTYNVVYGSVARTGILIDCSIVDFPSQNNLVYNNTSYGNAQSGIETAGVFGAVVPTDINNIFKNNLATGNIGGGSGGNLKAGAGAENVNGAQGQGSGNTYTYSGFGVQAANFIYWGYSNPLSTYAAWQSATGAGVGISDHYLNADPLFTNAAAGDFTLQAGSPAIGAGVVIPGVTPASNVNIGAK